MSHFAIPLLSDDGRLRERKKNEHLGADSQGKASLPMRPNESEECVTARGDG